MKVKRPTRIHTEVVLTSRQQMIDDPKAKLNTAKRAPEQSVFGALAFDNTFVPEQAMVSYISVDLI